MQHAGQVCVVTGAASGIGRALALELARRGAKVLVSDINLAGAREVADAINRMRADAASSHALDVTDADAVAALVAQVVGEHGRIDMMVNNAGIAVSGEARDLTLAQWRRVVDVNLMGVIYGADAAFKAMVAQGHGHVVNIASLAGLVPSPTNAPYTATKHAVVGLSLALRAEGEELGVKVSVVCPGFVESNIFNASEMVNIDRARLMANNPFPKVPTEIAAGRILDGVARNRPIIVFPLYAHVMWGLFRFWPRLLAPLRRRMLRDYRKLRGTQGERVVIDHKFIGYRQAQFEVEVQKVRLRLLAKAIGETDPVYFGEVAARAAGHRALRVPSTFFCPEMERAVPYDWFEELDIPLRQVLHGEQSFTCHRIA